MNSPLTPQQLGEIRQLYAGGSKIEAIKRYRELTGVGLAEAKDAVEKLAASDAAAPAGSSSGRLPTNVVQKSGCFGVVLILLGVAGAGAWLLSLSAR